MLWLSEVIKKEEACPPVVSHFSAFKRAGPAGMSLDFFFFKICKALVGLLSFQNLFSASVWDVHFPSQQQSCMLAHCSSHAFEFSLLFMLELRFSAVYSYDDSFRKKNERRPSSVGMMFRLVLECVFPSCFSSKER